MSVVSGPTIGAISRRASSVSQSFTATKTKSLSPYGAGIFYGDHLRNVDRLGSLN